MQLTQQIRIFPTPEQEEVLWVLSEKCRLIYNFALAERRDAYKNGVTGVTYRKQQNDLPKIKEQYPEYKWVYSKVLQYVLRTLNADYKSFFALRKKGYKDAQLPKFKGKYYFTTMVYNQSGFKVENRKVAVSHFYNDIPLEFIVPEKFSFIEDTCIKQVSIFNKDDRYFVSITYEVEDPPYIDNRRYQAIDLGITNIVTAVNTAGKFLVVKNKRPDKYWHPRITKLQARRDKCIKFSNRWKHFDRRVKKY